MKKNITCVASSAKAYFYISELQSRSDPHSQLLATLENSEARLKDQELISSPRGQLTHGVMEPEHTAKETLLSRFVKEVVHDLDNYYLLHGPLEVVLVANPKVMGLLRKELPVHIESSVILSLEKDYVSMNQADLSIILRDLLFPALKAS